MSVVKWVVGGQDNSNKPRLAYSYDGLNFTNVTTTIFGTTTGSAVYAVAHSGGIWVAGATLASAGSATLGYSYNGIDWVASTNSASVISAVRSLAYGNGRFVAIGSNAAYSTDGINWNSSPYPISGWLMGVNFSSPYFVAVGGNNFGAQNSTIAYSTDATSWTLSNTKRLSPEVRMVESDGNGKWVAVGTNANPSTAEIAYTTNITSTATEAWTFSNSGYTLFDYRANFVKYGNGKFIVNGYTTGQILTSTDGITWSSKTSTNFASGNDATGFKDCGINYYENRWVMGQKTPSKCLLYSTDNGGTWSIANISNTNAILGVGRYNPYVLGSTPVINSIASGLNKLTISFSQLSTGNPAATYYYSFDGITKLGSSVSSSPLVVTNLTTIIPYSICIIANNSILGDLSSNFITGTPYYAGTAPSLNSVTPALNSLTVNYSASTGGNPSANYYYYSIDNSFVAIGAFSSTITISGLTTSVSRSIYVGARGRDASSTIIWDLSSSSLSAIPYVKGSLPTLTVDSSINSLVLNIIQSTGGNPSTLTYYYSLNGAITIIGSYVAKYTIPNLLTSASISVYVGARGIDNSDVTWWDASSSTVSKSPYIIGSTPTISIDSSMNSLILNIGQSTGGNPAVSSYYYYIDSSFVSIGSYVAKYKISGLNTNASRSIYVGARGNDSSVIAWDTSSAIISATPYIKGGQPTLSIDSSINSLVLNIGQSTGGYPITSYYYFIDGSYVLIGSYASKYTITGLTTNVNRSIYVGVRGYDGTNTLIWDSSSSTQTAKPYIKGSFPTLSIDSSTNSLVLNIGQSTGGNPAVSSYYYSIDGSFVLIGSYVSKYTIYGLNTNASRSIYVGAIGYDGTNTLIWDASSSIQTATPYIVGTSPTIDSTVSGINQLTVYFSQTDTGNSTTKYYYSFNGTTKLGSGVSSSPLTITGLTSTTPYNVYIIANNLGGDVSSNSVTGNVFGSKPTTSLVSGINKLTVTYSQSSAGTSTTTFYYSLNGDSLISAPASPFDISGLTSTSPYSFYILARNPAGDISSNIVTENVFGSKPTTSLVSGINKLTVTYSQLTEGTSTTTYYYSLNGGSLVSAPMSPFDISGLTSTSPYSLYILARNPAGDISSNSVTGNVFGSNPTTSLVSGINKLTVTYSQTNVGTSTTTYYYSLNNGSLVSAPASPFDISELTSTSPYSFYVLARNPAGDISSNSVTGNVFGSKPTTSLVSGINKLTVTYSQSSAGTSTTTIYYSLNGGSLVSAPASPFDISGLTGTSPYSFYILVRNPAGDISSNIVTGNVFGSKPTTSLVSGINKLTVTYSQTNVGTSTTTYYYSLNGGSLLSATASPFDISGLTSTSPYSFYVLARNPAGDISSNSVTGNVFGSKPTVSLLAGINKLTVTYSQSSAGTSTTTFYYSLNGDSLVSAPTSPFDISGLTIASPYSLYILARNPAGDISSNAVTETPYVVGTNPNITSITSGINKITVDFNGSTGANPEPTYYYSYLADGSNRTGPVTSPFDISGITTTKTVYIVANNTAGNVISTGGSGTPYVVGSPITLGVSSAINSLVLSISQSIGVPSPTYYYSIDGSFVSIGEYTSSYTITGLTTNSTRSIYAGARAYGTSNNIIWDVSSTVHTATPYVVGSTPIITSITPDINKLTVSFSASTGANPEPTYYYSYFADGSGSIGPVTSSFDISGITTEKTVYIVANNTAGNVISSGVSGTPYVLGTAPIISSVVSGLNKITVDFNGSTGANPEPTYYYSYSSDGTNRTGPVVSPFDISSITTEKTVYIVASNAAGNVVSSGSSGTPYVIGSAPVINTVIPGVNSLTVDFTGSTGGYPSPITYYYSLDGGNYVNANTTTSPIFIGNLTVVKPYAVTLIAQNAGGNTAASNSVSGIPEIVSTGIKITPATYWRYNYWSKSSYWKRR